MELNFRTLNADEIDVRVGQVVFNEKTKGCTLLLYKDARVDMNLLDEVAKPLNWRREHSRDNANCVVSIWDEKKAQWVSKEDTGTESNTEKEKGLASDSFKRACVNWGIGRELYTAPLIFVNLSDGDFRHDSNGRHYLQNSIKFFVKEINYDEKRQINKLVIVNQLGTSCFTFDKNAKVAAKKEPAKPAAQPKPQPQPKAVAPAAKKPELPQQKTYSLPPLTAEENEQYLEFMSDISSADTIAAVEANVTLAIGQKFEDAVRRAAAKRGISLATSKEELYRAYDFVKDHEGWQEIKTIAIQKAHDKGWAGINPANAA